MRNTRATITVKATANVSHHCEHDPDMDGPGLSSWVIGELFKGDVTVYLEGTDDEVLAFADRIYAAVTQHRADVAVEATA
jgi:hypothetical protein